jgi:hypothetical protein
VNSEVIYKTQIATAGPQKDKILERYEKNATSTRRTMIIQRLFISIILIAPSVFPIISLREFLSIPVTTGNAHALVFTNSLIFAMYNVIIFLYLFLFGIMNLVTFMKGECYSFLRQYPLTAGEMQQLTIFTLIRMYLFQIVVVLFAIPVGSLIFTFSPYIFIILLLNNALNLIFAFFALIIVAYVLAQKVFNSSEKSIVGNIIMFGTIVIYVASIIPLMAGTSTMTSILVELYSSSTIISSVTPELSFLLSLLVFPFSTNYLTTLLLIPIEMIPIMLITTSIIGVLAFLGLTYVTIRKGNSLIRRIAYDPVDGSYTRKTGSSSDITVKVTVSHPIVMFAKKSLRLLSRDFGTLSYFFLGMIFPLMFFFSLMSVPRYSQGLLDSGSVFIIVTMAIGFTTIFLNESLASSEKNFGIILASLPFKTRHLFRSRQIITFIAAQVPVIAIVLIGQVINQEYVTDQFLQMAIMQVFIGAIAMTTYMLLFSVLYGKVNKTYTLFEVNLERKILKYIIQGVVIYGVVFSNIIIINISYIALKNVFDSFIGIVFIVNLFYILILEIIARRMFK